MANHSRIILAALAPAFAVCAQAQVTTSAINGSVVDENSQPVMGAAVIATHTPSGTRYRAVSNADGRFVIQGMRTGGPYTVTVSYIGYATTTYEKLYLELGNALPLNAVVKPSDTQLGEATVTATAKPKGGGAKNFSLTTITSTPTVDRSISDIVRNTPMAQTSKNGGITIAGTNNRYNSFQIDGTVANDVFGLSAGATNGAQTGSNPISMDAIQEIQVVVAPYDVRQGGFTGGGINAITKQGTNTTHGTAYAYYNNQKMYGKYNAARDYQRDPLSKQHEQTFGGTLGGAILKDKLFYFVSAEGHRETYPSSYYPGYTSKYINEATAQQILERYQELTGLTDSYGARDIDRKSFNLMTRIDYNINERNTLALRYQYNNSYKDSWSSGSSTYYFINSGFRYNNKTHSLVAELNSHLSDVLYNEFRGSYTRVRDEREVPYLGPYVSISNVKGDDGETNNTVRIGTEYSSGANELDQDVWSIEDNLSYYLGQHTLTFGTHNEVYSIRNLFLQNVAGGWTYTSLANFMNDAPSNFYYAYTDPDLTGSLRYAPTCKAAQFGFYAQDKWVVNSDFNFTYGLRFDIPTFFNKPTENTAFNTFADQRGLGVHVGDVPSTRLMVSPRVGFNWYADADHNTLLRGGLGIFTGRVPFVWISNVYNNNGIEVKHFSIYDSSNNAPNLADHKDDLVGTVQGLDAKSEDIAVVSKKFKFPQVFRANLALEQQLPGDIKMTLEGIYSKNLNNVFFENLALVNNGAKVYAVPGMEASAAPYYSQVSGNYSNIIGLRNTNKGYSYALSALLEKHFNFGLDLQASYTFGHSKSVNDGTSSVAYSNWQYNYSRDTNGSGELSYSKFDIPHRIMVSVNYNSKKYLNGLMSTTVGIIYNGTSGGRYSLTMNETKDYNGDGARGNSLLYIPTNEELALMNFASEEDRSKFQNWIENDKYAKDHRGQYAVRNSNMTHWENEINLHVGQTIYNPKGIGKLEITFDVMNFANMLNKKWGATYGNVYNVSPLTLSNVTLSEDGMTASPTFKYNSNSAPSHAAIDSRWHCQVGLRLSF
jgi:hypothetical protein